MIPRRLYPFEYLAPKSLAEAVSLLRDNAGRARAIAGGTDLLISMKLRQATPSVLVGLRGIIGLDRIAFDPATGLTIGALATLSAIAESKVVKDHCGPLAAACRKMGTPEIRNMGTIGGNLGNAGPSADTASPLLALRANLNMVSPKGERTVAVEDFFAAPFRTVLEEDELIREIHIPAPAKNSSGAYEYLTKISAVDETLVGVAVWLTLEESRGTYGEARIGLCSVAPTPMRAHRAEEFLKGKKVELATIEEAGRIAAGETNPRSRADYRRQMTAVLVKRALIRAAANVA